MSENRYRIFIELADTWEAECASGVRAAALRECADALRMMVDHKAKEIDTRLQPSRAPTHRCRECGAFWMEWSTGWSLCSKQCGPCCDNSPDFPSKLDQLALSDTLTRVPDPRLAALKSAGDKLVDAAHHEDTCYLEHSFACRCGLEDALTAWNTRAPTAERIAALEGEVERLREALMVLRDLPIVENDNPDTLHIDGVAYQGPVVDFLFYVVRKTKMISRAALKGTDHDPAQIEGQEA